MTYIGLTDISKVRRCSIKARMTITGPNDVSRVVWATSESTDGALEGLRARALVYVFLFFIHFTLLIFICS
jgi:hypothetical protein